MPLCALLVHPHFPSQLSLQWRHLVAEITHDTPQTDPAALPGHAVSSRFGAPGSDSWKRLIGLVEIIMDIHHPGLIGDCLISVFTFLKEDDLIVASCVCKVSGVATCGSTSCTKGKRLICDLICF